MFRVHLIDDIYETNLIIGVDTFFIWKIELRYSIPHSFVIVIIFYFGRVFYVCECRKAEHICVYRSRMQAELRVEYRNV